LSTPAATPISAGTTPPRRVLPTIVVAQWLGVSPWFAVNAVMADLPRGADWPETAVATLSSALQLGFIAGTLLFALLAITDRFAPRRLFLGCALASAACTVTAVAVAHEYPWLLACRVLTGFCLAGIYPVGMKLAAQWFPRGLGPALGWLIGALVLGSASPHALRALAVSGLSWPWETVFYSVAGASVVGGLLVVALVPPHVPTQAPNHAATPRGGPQRFRVSALAVIWQDRRLRASAGGYFGHMVELYTLWVLMPLVLATRLQGAALSWWAFAILGAGALGCIGGGLLSPRWGSARVAALQLGTSGLCCLLAPLALWAPLPVFLAWLLLWGVTVAGDSPQFSALTAGNAPPAVMGSVLTGVNSIGFAISAVSIEVFVRAATLLPLDRVLPALAIGPALGLWLLRPLLRNATINGGPARR
jgi:MFS transporter, DHA1 family, inner membrane transport protein